MNNIYRKTLSLLLYPPRRVRAYACEAQFSRFSIWGLNISSPTPCNEYQTTYVKELLNGCTTLL
jgi:hypothetical protein